MSVPKLRFTGFPDDWNIQKLKNIATITTGSTPSTFVEEYYNGERLFVSPADLQGNRFITSTKTTVTELGFLQGRKINKGSILFVCIGSTIGKIAINKTDCITNQQINAITCNEKNTNAFLYSLLQKNGKRIKRLAGKQAVPQINKSEFSDLKFSFPYLQEQEKIASFFTVIDQKLNLLKEKKEKLELYKKGVMQQIFSQKLRFKDEKGNEFPEWEEKKLRDICEISKGKQLNVENMVENGLFPALNGGINYSGYTNSWNTEKETITISEGGNSCGFVSFINENFWCGGHCYALKEIKVDVKKKFLFQYLKYNELSIMRMRVGSGLPNIQKKGLNEFPIQIPHLKEQQKIANFLSALDSKINLVSTQIEKTELWKKGLLQQMFV